MASNLDKEIIDARRKISADGYPMSIGELTNLYRDDELIIHPEFQRYYRWTDTQKSRLIESILLGIPLPSIFVAQTETGVWEVVDGLQRLSTILQLQGELRNDDGDFIPPLKLSGTKYLPSLDGKFWKGANKEFSLTESQRLDIKRSKIDVKIIKRESSNKAKFDLFQRLNSYGSSLTPQELRSALVASVSSELLKWLEDLSHYPSFVSTTDLSEKFIEERYDLELAIRFLVLHNWPTQKLTQFGLRDLPQILDDECLAMAMSVRSTKRKYEKIFKATFDKIEASGGDKIFKRWNGVEKSFKGQFRISAFEIFAFGLGYHVANNNKHKEDLVAVAKRAWSRTELQPGFATGKSTDARLIKLIPLGRELLKL